MKIVEMNRVSMIEVIMERRNLMMCEGEHVMKK